MVVLTNDFSLLNYQDLVKTLSAQLSDLRDQMTEQRKQKQRIGLLNSAPSLLNLGATAASTSAAAAAAAAAASAKHDPLGGHH